MRLKLLFSAFCCWLACASVWADPTSLIRIGAHWRYYPISVLTALPDEGWKAPTYDDANWLEGPSGFSTYFGYYSEATTFDASIGTLLLRTTFSVADTNVIQYLGLRVDYQDGFVAYLNGHEVVRKGLAGGVDEPVGLGVLADPHAAGVAELMDITASKHLLAQGNNVLAIQVHRSGDYANMIFAPELVANLVRGPFLQDMSTNSVRIIWKTPGASDSVVEYGTNHWDENRVVLTNLVETHVMTLTNLVSDTLYHYRVTSSDGTVMLESDSTTFRTFRTNGPVRFLVVADTGWGSDGQYQVAQAMAREAVDMVLVVGDVVYPAFTLGRVDLRCFSVYQDQMSRVPFVFMYGNHDRYGNVMDFVKAFEIASTNTATEGLYYSFDHGEAHFVILDTDLRVGMRFDPASPQYQWLEKDLAATTKPWKFLFFHNTIRGSGPHRYDDYNGNGIPDRIEMQQSIGMLAARYGVQCIFNGHDHLYERLAPTNGVHAITTAGGGAMLYSRSGTPDEGSMVLRSEYHYVVAAVTNGLLTIEAADLHGGRFDSCVINNQAPPRQEHVAQWVGPRWRESLDHGGTGSFLGIPHFLGDSGLATTSGQQANLGVFQAANDAFVLYMGFNEVMLHDDQDLLLFVESPRLTGVTTMEGLGDGIADPDDQGIDALDMVANLSFTNFAPSIACVLGDARGDEVSRSFSRPATGFAGGQGVFRLDSRLSSVSHAWLQQFDDRPGVSDESGENNANHIVVGIPLAELGGLCAGDVIKVGAVVGVGMANTNSNRQTRALDTAYLGYSLSTGTVSWLEGVTIHLAQSPDADGDGLDDAWEKDTGLDQISPEKGHGRMGDPDHDGLTNEQEWLAGTNPLDPESKLSLRAEAQPDGSVCMSWPAAPGRLYQLECSTDGITFSPIADGGFPQTGWNPIMAYHENRHGHETRLFRVRVMAPGQAQ